MELSELQKQANELVEKIDEKFNVKRDNNVAIVQLVEEMSEFIKLQSSFNLSGKEIDKEDMAEDLGDVLILLSNFASMNGIDLEKSFIDKIEKVKLKHLGGDL